MSTPVRLDGAHQHGLLDESSKVRTQKKSHTDGQRTAAESRKESPVQQRQTGPRIYFEQHVKLSDPQEQAELTPGAALSNFRARKKTFSEYLAPLTGLFSSRRTSALDRLSASRDSGTAVPDDERRRARELMIGTPMRRFSLTRAHNIQRSGTLRVRIISCVSPKLRSSTTVVKIGNNSPLADIRKVSAESTGSGSSTGGSTPPPPHLANRVRHFPGRKSATPSKRAIQYYVEMELGAARGKTLKKERLKNSRRGEVRWDDSDAWVRLFVPGVEEGGDPILLAVSEAAKQATANRLGASRRPLQVLRLRVMSTVCGANDGDSEVHIVLFETAVELDRLIRKGAPRLLELPLVNRDDLGDEDLGVLTIETRFERLNPRRLSQDEMQFVEAAENLAAETTSVLIMAGRTPSLLEMDDREHGTLVADSAFSPVLMVPSAAAYLTTIAAGLVPTSLPPDKAPTRVSQKLRVVYEHEESLRASWPLCTSEAVRQRTAAVGSRNVHSAPRRFSCPAPSQGLSTEGGEALIGANAEQLESLREGWRMWRMAHRSQLQPSHRAQDLANAGERFINRTDSSANFGSFSPTQSLKLSSRLSSANLGSPSLSLLDRQPSAARMHALFELGGDTYDMSTYLEDHPHQRAFLNSISARVGKIAMLEQQASLSDEEDSAALVSSGDRQRKRHAKPKRPSKSGTSAGTSSARPWCRHRVAVLTGGTSGIGEVIGRELCARGIKRLIILVRNLASGRSKALSWTEKFKNVEVDVVPCDLSDMRETNAAVAQIRELLAPNERVDLLILCAACVSNDSSQRPKKEFEETFAVNYMANFLLIHALFSVMERSPETNGLDGESRIVIAGCAAVPPFGNKVDLLDLQASQKGLGQLGVAQYIHTKTMLLCFAGELGRRLADKHCGVTVNVFFPGAVKSRLADRVLESFNPVLARLADAAYGLTEGVFVRSPEQGASLALHLCSSQQISGVSGKVFHSGLTGVVTDFEPHPPFGVATNTELCRKLWAISGKMLNQALGNESRVAEWWDYFKPARPRHSTPIVRLDAS